LHGGWPDHSTLRVACSRSSQPIHRFYDYQPDLNTANPAVRAEIKKILGFWLALGVSGFRVDAAPFVIAHKGPEIEKQPHESFEFIDEFREYLSWKRGDAVFLAEADATPAQLGNFFGERGNRMNQFRTV